VWLLLCATTVVVEVAVVGETLVVSAWEQVICDTALVIVALMNDAVVVNSTGIVVIALVDSVTELVVAVLETLVTSAKLYELVDVLTPLRRRHGK
jgi:hypothetical protein